MSALLGAVAAAAVTDQTALSPIRPPGLWHWAWVLGVIVAFAAYAVAVFRLRSRQVALRPVLLVAVVMQLAPLSGPLLLSTDVYAYWSYGRLAAIHHINPYVTQPDAVLKPDQLGSDPGAGTTIYGPGFTAAEEVHALVVGDSRPTADMVYRVAAAVGVLVLLLIVAIGVERPAFPIALIGWSPLFALHFAGGGHNDIWMLVFAVGGVLLGRHKKPVAAGVAWTLSAFVKAPTLFVLPLEAVAIARRDGRRAGARMIGGFAVAALLLGALATLHYGTAWIPFLHGTSEIERTTSLSMRFRLGQLGVPSRTAQVTLAALSVLGYLRLGRDAWRGRARLGLAASLVLFGPTSWLVPWYGSWPVAFAAIEDDLFAQVVAVAATAYLLTDALPL